MREGMRIGRWKLFFFERVFSLSFLHRAFCSMNMQITTGDSLRGTKSTIVELLSLGSTYVGLFYGGLSDVYAI
jgi:hypothetical protein